MKPVTHHDSHEAFQELKKLKQESHDPQTVYRMANVFQHKLDDFILRYKLRNATVRQIILDDWPNETAEPKAKHKKYGKAYNEYRHSIINNAANLAKFIKEHKPLKEQFTEKELKTRHAQAKNTLWMEAMTEAILKWCSEVVL